MYEMIVKRNKRLNKEIVIKEWNWNSNSTNTVIEDIRLTYRNITFTIFFWKYYYVSAGNNVPAYAPLLHFYSWHSLESRSAVW